MSRLDAIQPLAQTDHDGQQVPERAGKFDRPWFCTETAADYLEYTGPGRLESVYRFIKTNGIAVRRRSVRSILIAKADIDRALAARKARG